MLSNPLGRTGLSVSRLGYGAAPIGFLDTEAEQIGRLMNELLDQGVTLIDTAAAYKGSEAAIGAAVSARRSEYTLVSKCGMGDDGLPGEPWSPERLTATIERSLQRLQTDHLDVCLLHSCDLETLQKGDAIGALVAAREAGKIRFAGYSGDNGEAVWAAARPEIAVIETSINLCDQANLKTVLPVCQAHDTGVIAKRPIANAAWKSTESQQGFYKNYAAEYHRRFERMGLTPADLGYSGHPEVEWPEIALKFTLAHAGVHSAICGTTSTVNAQANVAAIEKNPLREEVVQRLVEAFDTAEAADDQGPWLGLT